MTRICRIRVAGSVNSIAVVLATSCLIFLGALAAPVSAKRCARNAPRHHCVVARGSSLATGSRAGHHHKRHRHRPTAHPTAAPGATQTTTGAGGGSTTGSGSGGAAAATGGETTTPASGPGTTNPASGPGSTSPASGPVTTSTANPAAVTGAPVGPAAPVGGWALEYGDAFGAPLGTGTGQDNTVWPSRVTSNCTNNPGYNSNELEVFNCSQVTTDANGLELNCTRVTGLSQPFNCGAVTTITHAGTAPPAGYRLFNFTPGQGQEWALQIVTKFPPNTGDADPGWWATTPTWQWEWDMFEAWGAQAGAGGSWCQPGKYVGTTDPTFIYSPSSGSMVQGVNDLCRDSGFDPSAAYHTYTTVMYPDRSMSEWIDGRLMTYTSGSAKGSQTVTAPPSVRAVMGGLILSYALRNVAVGSTDPYFPSGTRTWSTRSIAVYENATASGANTVNPGIAPGTQIR